MDILKSITMGKNECINDQWEADGREINIMHACSQSIWATCYMQCILSPGVGDTHGIVIHVQCIMPNCLEMVMSLFPFSKQFN